MEKVKTYHRNLDVICYDYKKACDKVHNDWKERVYAWMDISENMIALLSELINYCKRKFEIAKNSKKELIDESTLYVAFFSRR